ncbi:MAG: hypothetical protein VW405_01260 [Rhodospirillaceae bacterium]
MSDSHFQIAVLDRGFVYVGHVSAADGWIKIEGARCVRRWGTTRGLGQLAAEGPQEATKLDPAGTVRAPLSSVVHLIDADPTKWAA